MRGWFARTINFSHANIMTQKREKYCFGCVVKNQIAGEYWATTPCFAGKKILRNLLGNLDVDKIQFDIINLQTKKMYRYVGYRMKITDPNKRMMEFINPKTGKVRRFFKNYEYVVKRYHDDPTLTEGS